MHKMIYRNAVCSVLAALVTGCYELRAGVNDDGETMDGAVLDVRNFVVSDAREMGSEMHQIVSDAHEVDAREMVSDRPAMDAREIVDSPAIDVREIVDSPAIDAQCAAGARLCSGRCEDVRISLIHCGACGNACGVVANGATLCAGGMCSVTCAVGYRLAGALCVVAAGVPRQVSPLSLGNTTLRRPTLRWILPAGTDGATLELCRDRACTSVIETIRVQSSSARPSVAFAARSVVYWRLRGRVGAVEGFTNSPTWLFHVPLMDAAAGVDSSTHAHIDLNGDGVDDVAVGSRYASPGGRSSAGKADVFLSTGAAGIGPVATVTIEGLSNDDEFGSVVAGAGDLNGDGFGDLAVGAPNADRGGRVNAGSVSIFYGSSMGISAIASAVLEGVNASDRFGGSLATAGDLNLDGYGDLVVGAPTSLRIPAGTASIFHGGVAGIGPAAVRVLTGLAANDNFGRSVASAGDVNGDGFSDLVVGAPNADANGRSNAGRVSVFHGSVGGISMLPNRELVGAESNDGLGFVAVSAGDVNGDGYSDLAASAPGHAEDRWSPLGVVMLWHGGVTGIPAGMAQMLSAQAEQDSFGMALARAGDINADGFGDLVVGAPLAGQGGTREAGAVSVYHGSARGLLSMSARVFQGAQREDNFGLSVAGTGDVNGDSFDDVVFGAPRTDPAGRTDAGTIVLYYGSVGGVNGAVARRLDGALSGDWFGYSVAN